MREIVIMLKTKTKVSRYFPVHYYLLLLLYVTIFTDPLATC